MTSKIVGLCSGSPSFSIGFERGLDNPSFNISGLSVEANGVFVAEVSLLIAVQNLIQGEINKRTTGNQLSGNVSHSKISFIG